jgi:hypothetical protein
MHGCMNVKSLILPLTSALDRGGRSPPLSGRFTPGKVPVPTVYGAEWTPKPVWTSAENLAPSPPLRFDPHTFQPV